MKSSVDTFAQLSSIKQPTKSLKVIQLEEKPL